MGELKLSGIMTYTLECLKSRRLIIPTIGEDMGLLEPSYTAAESITWYNHFDNWLNINY